ncbi:MAG: hypothetical protein NTV68_04620, partial [Methanomicrobiales archaeon]|nr:hypothetical protein [Methanomicrobiales archaeon]
MSQTYTRHRISGLQRLPRVIENVRRDLNIALMNELSMIFARLGISMDEVLKAAGTKWNFHQYR